MAVKPKIIRTDAEIETPRLDAALRRRGELVGVPDVMSHGFVGPDEEPALHDSVRRLVTNLFGGEGRQLDRTGMRERLKDEVASHLYRETHRRPLVLPVTVEV